jgi:hypothetical protein
MIEDDLDNLARQVERGSLFTHTALGRAGARTRELGKLDFPLSVEEVETGALAWDLGRPYLIRHEADGLRVHNDRATGGCGVYEDRPCPCRQYCCATDERIWKDFERMELNEEWLEEHLAEPPPRLLHGMLAERERSGDD